MEIIIVVAVITLLIAVNALYVAAEFAAVSARRPRLARLGQDGDPLARYLLETVETPHKLDTYVAACQLGITVSSLALGFYGQSRLLALLSPYISGTDPATQLLVNSALITAILIVLTIFQVLLGELMPKNVALQFPEQLALLTARPMRWSVKLFHPFILIFNGSARLILRLAGLAPTAEHAHVHSLEEIQMLVEESSAGGILDEEERRLLVNTLQLRNLNARKVMIPRNHMLAAPVDMAVPELFQLLANSNFSRIPVYEETIDNILGIVHLKDLIGALYAPSQTTQTDPQSKPAQAAPPQVTVRNIMHPALFIPDSVEVGDVMRLMQQERRNIVIIVDEYGGTAGMISFEDLVEEIIGEFQDEYDLENPSMELRQNQRLRIRGDVLIEEVNDVLATAFYSDEVDTIGGLVFSELGYVPAAGETVELDGMTFRVDRVEQNAIAYVSVLLDSTQAEHVSQIIGKA